MALALLAERQEDVRVAVLRALAEAPVDLEAARAAAPEAVADDDAAAVVAVVRQVKVGRLEVVRREDRGAPLRRLPRRRRGLVLRRAGPGQRLRLVLVLVAGDVRDGAAPDDAALAPGALREGPGPVVVVPRDRLPVGDLFGVRARRAGAPGFRRGHFFGALIGADAALAAGQVHALHGRGRAPRHLLGALVLVHAAAPVVADWNEREGRLPEPTLKKKFTAILIGRGGQPSDGVLCCVKSKQPPPP